MGKKTSVLEISLPNSCIFITRLLAPSSRLSVVSRSSAYSPRRPVADLMRSSSTMYFLSSAGEILPAATLPRYSAARAAASRRTAFMSRAMRGSPRLAYKALRSQMMFSDPSFAAFIDSSSRAWLFGYLMIPHNTGVSTVPIRHSRLRGTVPRVLHGACTTDADLPADPILELPRPCYNVMVPHAGCQLRSKEVGMSENDVEVTSTRRENTPHQAAFWKVSGSFLSKLLGFVRGGRVAAACPVHCPHHLPAGSLQRGQHGFGGARSAGVHGCAAVQLGPVHRDQAVLRQACLL